MSPKQKLIEISKQISNIIGSYNKTDIQRTRKVDFFEAFAFESLYSHSTISQEKVCSKINSYNYDKLKSSCVKSYINRCEQMPIKMIYDIQDLFVKNPQKSNELVKLAVDGSHINLPKLLSNNDFSLNQNQETSNGFIMGIFNISKTSPEMITLNKSRDERKAISEFISKSNGRYENSVLIFDRGYYSEVMEKMLNKTLYFSN